MNDDSEWARKGATLTDGTAQKEYGLTREEIVDAVRSGKLSYRQASIYGNPCLRLLRREVETFVDEQRGGNYLKDRQRKTELARINRKLRQLRKQVAALEKRKSDIMGDAQ